MSSITDDTIDPNDTLDETLTRRMIAVLEAFGPTLALMAPREIALALRAELGSDPYNDSNAHRIMENIRPLVAKLTVDGIPNGDPDDVSFDIAHAIGHYLERNYELVWVHDHQEES